MHTIKPPVPRHHSLLATLEEKRQQIVGRIEHMSNFIKTYSTEINAIQNLDKQRTIFTDDAYFNHLLIEGDGTADTARAIAKIFPSDFTWTKNRDSTFGGYRYEAKLGSITLVIYRAESIATAEQPIPVEL